MCPSDGGQVLSYNLKISKLQSTIKIVLFFYTSISQEGTVSSI